MTNRSDLRSIIIILSVLLFVVSGTLILSFVARGYQLNLKNGPSLDATGILSLTSRPKGASVYLNDRLVTATDDTVNLTPGQYNIKMVKDGFLSWQKSIIIKKEVVYTADVQLIRSAPDIKPVSLSGAINPTISADLTKIIYAVASASAQKDNGLYLVELQDNPINLTRGNPRQIFSNTSLVDWSLASFEFSPNSKQIIATFTNNSRFLIDLSSSLTPPAFTEITPARLITLKKEWSTQSQEILTNKLSQLPKSLASLVSTQSAQSINFDSTDEKVLYLAGADGQLEDHLIDAPPAQSTQIQSRSIKKGYYYVYDLKDDTNFLIGNSQDLNYLTWIPGSNSLIYRQETQVQAMEYDGTNIHTVYSGINNQSIVAPWGDGSRIITQITPYSGAVQNLYSISLK